MHACAPSTGKAEPERSWVYRQFWLHNKFQASLSHRVRETQSSNFPTPKECENTFLLMFSLIIYSSILNLFLKTALLRDHSCQQDCSAGKSSCHTCINSLSLSPRAKSERRKLIPKVIVWLDHGTSKPSSCTHIIYTHTHNNNKYIA